MSGRHPSVAACLRWPRAAVEDAATVQSYLAAFEQAGCDEVTLFPCASDPA
ncbi:MAG TPA: hypothetical protein VMT37_02420 [Solirubrobacterales bacterium]|nr:hypothetical protein [Solirubrobacterales bacterium]